jgi:hypothetical protein
MSQTVRILSISAVSGAPGRLYIGNRPGFRTQHPQESSRVKGPGPNLQVIRLLDQTSSIRPETL